MPFELLGLQPHAARILGTRPREGGVLERQDEVRVPRDPAVPAHVVVDPDEHGPEARRPTVALPPEEERRLGVDGLAVRSRRDPAEVGEGLRDGRPVSGRHVECHPEGGPGEGLARENRRVLRACGGGARQQGGRRDEDAPSGRLSVHADNMGRRAARVTGLLQELLFFPKDVALRFGDCLFDPESRQLFRGGTPVPLSPKAWTLLDILVRSRPRAMSKPELQEALWPDTFVVEANLANLVAELREAMGEKGQRDGYLRTVHGFGYAFSGEALEASGVRAASAVSLVRDGRGVPLVPGENVLGRDPEAAVFVDDSTVSRRHARIAVHGSEAVLEDLGSKNGTTVNGKTPDGPVALRHGDAVLLGAVLLTVRVAAAAGETATIGPGGVAASA
jgi:DNA-binding winged helix-turn-helix (wHTH) protein